MLGRLQQTKQILFCWSHTWQQKKKKKRERERKRRNKKTLNFQPIKSFSTPSYTKKTGGLQHHQILSPNLLER
jgi:hypothetical protein